MRLKGKIEATIKLAPNGAMLMKPMSHTCRDLIYGLLEWGCGKLQYFGQNANNLITRFCEQFNQISYEDTCQTYNTEQFLKVIVGIPGNKKDPGVKVKNAEDVLDIMWLRPLDDSSWVNSHNIDRTNCKIGELAQHIELYNWIINQFIDGDFTKYDLNKIIEMGRLCSFETIKKEAQQIKDVDKRNIPYLYAIIRSTSSKNDYKQEREAVANTANDIKLSELIELATEAETKVPYVSNPNSLEKWVKDREFIDILRKINDDGN